MTNISRILVPVDFSETSRAALRYAGYMAQCCGALVEAFHVWEPPASVPQADLLAAGGDMDALWTRTQMKLRHNLEALVHE